MGAAKRLWDDVTGKTAARKQEEAARRANEQAKRDQDEANANAARQSVFAETEGMGKGVTGQVTLGVDDKIVEDDLDPRKRMFL